MKTTMPALSAFALLFGGFSCSEDISDMTSDASPLAPDARDNSMLPYAREVIRFAPGEGAGFGNDKLPDVVLGQPHGMGTGQASLDVLSLGVGGTIELGFGDKHIIDGDGPDFVVFENPFWVNGDESNPFAEPGQVSVSMDGSTWLPFPCNSQGNDMGQYTGCAGFSPTLEYDAFSLLPLDFSMTGGDAFDLADVGLSEARFVRIVDTSIEGEMPSAGFDLDAVGLLHWAENSP